MKIRQVKILSPNLIETEKFYAGILGFKPQEKTSSAISFAIGDSKLTFVKTAIPKPVYHFAFNIPKNKLNEAEEWIAAKVSIIAFENKSIIDFPNWNAKSLYFFDTNGNILEFIARFDLENESDTAFGTSRILSISEIAFVTDNVKALAEKLISENDFSFFDKQTQRPDFSVIGEDHGLLILVDSQRNWFPTQIKAESFWMEVCLENNGNLIKLEHQ